MTHILVQERRASKFTALEYENAQQNYPSNCRVLSANEGIREWRWYVYATTRKRGRRELGIGSRTEAIAIFFFPSVSDASAALNNTPLLTDTLSNSLSWYPLWRWLAGVSSNRMALRSICCSRCSVFQLTYDIVRRVVFFSYTHTCSTSFVTVSLMTFWILARFLARRSCPHHVYVFIFLPLFIP